jgi:hypothetical protein
MKKPNKRYPTPLIEHTAYNEALELAHTHLSRADPGTLLLVVGMSGAGKNTLSEEIERRLVAKNPQLRAGEKPVVKLIAINAENSYYSSKDAASRLVDVLDDPFRSTKRDELLKKFGLKTAATSHRSVPETILRRSATRLLEAKNTQWLILDEADMMCVIKSSGRDAADHLESWRLVALESKTVIVLLGTYRILTIWDRTSQFTRKMPTVHVRRYDAANTEDVNDFQSLVSQMCEYFKVSEEETAKILAQGRALIYATGGIFGQLLALFERADEHAESRKRPSITLEDVRHALPRKKQISKLWEEIADGEHRLESADFEDVAAIAAVAMSSSLSRVRTASAERTRHVPKKDKRARTGRPGKRGPKKRLAVRS